jgi:hypothetical protein
MTRDDYLTSQMQHAPSNKLQWRDDAKRMVEVTGDGALVFLSAVKESTDAFPPLKSAAAGILVLADLSTVRPTFSILPLF